MENASPEHKLFSSMNRNYYEKSSCCTTKTDAFFFQCSSSTCRMQQCCRVNYSSMAMAIEKFEVGEIADVCGIKIEMFSLSMAMFVEWIRCSNVAIVRSGDEDECQSKAEHDEFGNSKSAE